MAVARIYKAQCGLESNVSFSDLLRVLRKTATHTHTHRTQAYIHAVLGQGCCWFTFYSNFFLLHITYLFFGFFVVSQLSRHYSLTLFLWFG